jgi:hypothetical protein
MSKEDSNPNTCWIHYSSTNSTSAEKLIPVDCKFVSIDPGILTIYNMDTDESCIGKVYTSGNDILSATKSLANTGLEAFTSEKRHFFTVFCQ